MRLLNKNDRFRIYWKMFECSVTMIDCFCTSSNSDLTSETDFILFHCNDDYVTKLNILQDDQYIISLMGPFTT